MKAVWTMTLRAMKLYLKNPLALLFSFVYMLLIMSLFGLFLGEYMANGMKEIYSEVQGINLDAMLPLVNASAMAGVLMINCILVPLNVLTIMVQDNTDKRINSFLVSGVSRDKLVLGYWLAPFIVCVLLNILCLFISQGFVVMSGGNWLDLNTALKMCVVIAANSFSTTSILFLVAMLINNSSAYNTVTGIVSALVGFITGTFIPLGVFPESIQKVFAVLPAHYGATMTRGIMTKPYLDTVFGNVQDQIVMGTFMSASEIVEVYAAENGIAYSLNGSLINIPTMLLIVIGSGILFLAVDIILMASKRNSG